MIESERVPSIQQVADLVENLPEDEAGEFLAELDRELHRRHEARMREFQRHELLAFLLSGLSAFFICVAVTIVVFNLMLLR